MYSKLLIFLGLFISLAMLARCEPLENAVSKAEIIKMIPRSHDLPDHQEQENLLKLIAAVDSVYPVLCEELLSTGQPRTQAYILAILGKTKKSKDQVLPAIREFMIRHKEDDPQQDSMFTGITTLGEIGHLEDAGLLAHFLEIGFDSSRVKAAQAIEQIRTREQARERDSERLKRNSKRGDVGSLENVDSSSAKGLPSSVSKTEKTRSSAVDFWPWLIGAAALIAVGLILRSRASRCS